MSRMSRSARSTSRVLAVHVDGDELVLVVRLADGGDAGGEDARLAGVVADDLVADPVAERAGASAGAEGRRQHLAAGADLVQVRARRSARPPRPRTRALTRPSAPTSAQRRQAIAGGAPAPRRRRPGSRSGRGRRRGRRGSGRSAPPRWPRRRRRRRRRAGEGRDGDGERPEVGGADDDGRPIPGAAAGAGAAPASAGRAAARAARHAERIGEVRATVHVRSSAVRRSEESRGRPGSGTAPVGVGRGRRAGGADGPLQRGVEDRVAGRLARSRSG